MKGRYLLALLFAFSSSALFGQEVKVGNSFIVVINNEVVSGVENLRFTYKDKIGKEDFVNGGYLPGTLFIDNIAGKNKFEADSTKYFLIKFQRFSNNRKFVYCYEISYNQTWLQSSSAILKIFDINSGNKYKYFLEIPGYSFPIKGVTVTRKTLKLGKMLFKVPDEQKRHTF